MTAPELSIVIPTYGTFALTRRCLAAIECHAGDVRHETIVVDDAGPGRSAEHAAREFPWARTLRNAENRGFAGACNAGWQTATAPLVLFLNDDAFAHAGALRALVAAFADPSIAIAGARLLYLDGTIQHAGMVWWNSPVGPRSRHAFWHLEGETPDALVARDYAAVTGAALAVRRSFLERVGGFDELYGNGYEDLDLCLRAWCSGNRVRYVPEAVFTHFEGATMGHLGTDRNLRAFYTRWRGVVGAIPPYPLPPLPETRVVTAPAPPQFPQIARTLVSGLAQVLVPIRTAPGALTIAVNTSSPDVIVATPPDEAVAAAMASSGARAYWAATPEQARLLCAAGVPAERVHVVNPGIARDAVALVPVAAASPPAVASYCDGARPPDAFRPLLAGLAAAARRVPGLRLVLLVERERDDALAFVQQIAGGVDWSPLEVSVTPVGGADPVVSPERLLGAAAFVALAPADPFEAATLSAAAAGVPIVRVGPPDAFIDDTMGFCVAPEGIADAVVAACGPAGAERALEARLHALRAFPRLLLMRRAGELLRQLAGGVPSAAVAEIGPAQAAALRAAGAAIARRLEAAPPPARCDLRWDRSYWPAETERAIDLAPLVAADVLVGVDLDDPAPAMSAIAAHRRRGVSVAIYPVRQSRAELLLAQVIGQAADDGRRAWLLDAMGKPGSTINGVPLHDADLVADDARAPMLEALRAGDAVVVETEAIAHELARITGWTPERLWIPSAPRAVVARSGAAVAIDARHAYRNELCFVEAALDGAVSTTLVAVDHGAPEQLEGADVVVLPRWGQPAAAARHRSAGRRIVVPAESGLDPGPGVETYPAADGAALRAAVLRAAGPRV